jgi:hypothetical protein
MRSLYQYILYTLGALGVLLLAACQQKPEAKIVRLPRFSITNVVAGGELREIIQVTNGLSFYFTKSEVCVWFRKDSSVVVIFDPITMIPTKTSLETPLWSDGEGEEVFDVNADGVPDIRRVKGRSEDIFYRGEWYPRHKAGTNTFILLNGQDVAVRFDGRRWVERAGLSDGQGQGDPTNADSIETAPMKSPAKH